MTGAAAAVQAIVRFVGFEGTANDLISRGKGPFFHYTDLNAFAAIVMKSDLWLTDARFSNDAEELEHGRKLILEVTNGHAAAGPTKEERAFAKAVVDRLSVAFKNGQDAAYICCFCENGDLLSQWRGYAGSGGGVAIEINPQAFGALAGMDCPIGVMRFWKVFYLDNDKRGKILQVLDFWARQPDPLETRAECAAATLGFFAPTFKNWHFKAEAEWRLIFTPYPTCTVPPKFRTARGLFTPYFELRELVSAYAAPALLPIKGVRMGPGPYQEVNKGSARTLLDSYGFKNARVDLSKIPHRG